MRHNRRQSKLLILAFLSCAAMLLGCGGGPSAGEVEQALEEANYCAAPEDCAVLYPGCPLGCYAVVNEAEAQAVQSLIDDYFDTHGHTCDYDCIAIGDPRCENGRCVVDPLQ